MSIDEYEVIQQLFEWHKGKVTQLNLIVEKNDADIMLGDIRIENGTELHKGIVFGVKIALEQLGELPLTINNNSEK
tara:strand:+ start:4537 stop:4764 length:228 start_codon:yes stop_codon:yes gene_type:complete